MLIKKEKRFSILKRKCRTVLARINATTMMININNLFKKLSI
jgi:hypothetical protein